MTTLETRARQLWNARPWHAYTACAKCGEQKHCTGNRRNSMTCLECFDLAGK